uniref:Uncharacterized protein n=1 Tax=Arundo donax TaxID=35708 RepID=A0A0A9CTR0_ARUDO
MLLESAPCVPKSVSFMTEEPVAMSKISYVKVVPAALVRVLVARSALTISVLRISSIPFSEYHSGNSLSPPLPTHT